ncbi:MAG: hemin uptake protein HemP [Curvibacter sp.]|nr:MAG: hemin uptake protein HemP [Curvibacter sp.]
MTDPHHGAFISPDRTAHPEVNGFAEPPTFVPGWKGVVPSSALLGIRQAIEIEHNGQRYRLQSTKSGKLILTK